VLILKGGGYDISTGSVDNDSTITEDLPIQDADSEHEAGETNGDAQSSDGTSSISEEDIPVEDRSASQDQSSVVLLASDCNLSSSVDSEREVMHCTLSFQSDKGL
jgi:hypothetical protein